MCLDKITSRKQYKKIRYGWKVFELHEGNLTSLCITHSKYHYYPINQWITAENSTVINNKDFFCYPSGFHVCVTKRSTKKWLYSRWVNVVRKVAYKNIIVYGRDSNEKVVVAKYIKILPE
jgi:hypothetical protein